MAKHKMRMALAGFAAIAVFSAACGTSSDTKSSPAAESSAPADKGGDTTDSGAAQLRAGLTALLQEHVYLAGAATGAALGGRDAEFKNAAAALDVNSVGLSKAIESVYGADAGKSFLELWRKHIGFFVAYTQSAAKNDDAGKAKARKDLDGYRADFGAFLASANPNLPKDAVAQELIPHVTTLFDAIDAQAAKAPDAFDKLKLAAGKMPNTASVLAGAISKQKADQFSGDSASGGSVLRSLLTAQLQEHVFLATFATGEALGGRDAGFKAAAGALDANSVELSKSIEAVYGADAGKSFLELWRKHIGFFVAYTQASAKNDDAGKAKARKDLDGYRADFGAFLASANPNLTKDAVAQELIPHVTSVFDVIDAQAAKDEGAYKKISTAAAVMPKTAQVLAGAINKQDPEKISGLAGK